MSGLRFPVKNVIVLYPLANSYRKALCWTAVFFFFGGGGGFIRTRKGKRMVPLLDPPTRLITLSGLNLEMYIQRSVFSLRLQHDMTWHAKLDNALNIAPSTDFIRTQFKDWRHMPVNLLVGHVGTGKPPNAFRFHCLDCTSNIKVSTAQLSLNFASSSSPV